MSLLTIYSVQVTYEEDLCIEDFFQHGPHPLNPPLLRMERGNHKEADCVCKTLAL